MECCLGSTGRALGLRPRPYVQLGASMPLERLPAQEDMAGATAAVLSPTGQAKGMTDTWLWSPGASEMCPQRFLFTAEGGPQLAPLPGAHLSSDASALPQKGLDFSATRK